MKENNKWLWYGYFSEINWSIKKIPIRTMVGACNMVKEELNKDVVKIFKIMKRNPRIFRFELSDGSVLRFEIIDLKFFHLIELQEEALLHHKGTPKIIFYKILGKRIFKFSEWIHGKIVSEVQHMNKVFVTMGETLAQLNKIEYKSTGLYLTNSELGMSNVVWTEDEKIFIIDHDRLKAVKESKLDASVFINLVKRVIYKDRVDMFLRGYSKYRSVDGVIKLGNKKDWTWKNKKGNIIRRVKEF